MASKRSHPVVCRMGGAIKAFVENELSQGGALEEAVGHDASILLRTGPGIWSSQVHSYAAQMGASIEELQTGGQVADLVVLPQVAFGCNFRCARRAPHVRAGACARWLHVQFQTARAVLPAGTGIWTTTNR